MTEKRYLLTYDGFTFNSYVKAKELLQKQLSL